MKYQEIAAPQQKVLLLMLQKECSKDLRSSRLLRCRFNDDDQCTIKMLEDC